MKTKAKTYGINVRWSLLVCLGCQKNDLGVLLDIIMEIEGECAKHIKMNLKFI